MEIDMSQRAMDTGKLLSNNLYHYGVLGMKWGVRKDRSSGTGSRTNKKNRQKNEKQELKDDKKRREQRKNDNKMIREAKRERREMSRKRFILSDDELQNRIKRLRLEKELRQLTTDELYPAKRIIEKVGDQTLKSALNSTTNAIASTMTRTVLDSLKKKR